MDDMAIDINQKFSLIDEYWFPKILGSINDYFIKLVKIKGHFTWHRHDDTDEVFIVHKGTMKIDFRDGSVELKPAQMFIVKKGVEHKPYAENECEVILFEPAATLNTGDVTNSFTHDTLEWV